jgi:hypothetical protein
LLFEYAHNLILGSTAAEISVNFYPSFFLIPSNNHATQFGTIVACVMWLNGNRSHSQNDRLGWLLQSLDLDSQGSGYYAAPFA